MGVIRSTLSPANPHKDDHEKDDAEHPPHLQGAPLMDELGESRA